MRRLDTRLQEGPELRANFDGKLHFGTQGPPGEAGGYYAPSLNEETGELSFTPSQEGIPPAKGGNVMGPPGQKGEPGKPGQKGDPGEPGAPGRPGAAATVSIGTTTTGEAGTEASVTNSGDSQNAVLNFTIPRGEKGEPGEPGAKGEPGAQGPATAVSVGETTTGEPGTSASVTSTPTEDGIALQFTIPRGADGAPGAKGDPGAPGAQGEPGTPGASGLLPVTQTGNTTLTLAANTCTVVTGQPTALTVTLGDAASGTETGWRLIFQAGEGFSLSAAAPQGYAIHWETEPAWQAGSVYEVRFADQFLAGTDGNIIIGAAWKAWA